jgi:GMP synthase-like glutamine amidotransferase
MILLLDLCYEKDSLSQYEFVYPIADTLTRSGSSSEIRHFTELNEIEWERYDRIILCGTALKDNHYVEKMELFSWILNSKKPILGICAGMQVISAVFGGKIMPQPAIGLANINIIRESNLLGRPREIEGYHLHNFGVTLPEGFLLLAGKPDGVEAFCHPTGLIFGIVFHPEVRNRWIIERFARLPPLHDPSSA